jgi:hypothetical protein
MTKQTEEYQRKLIEQAIEKNTYICGAGCLSYHDIPGSGEKGRRRTMSAIETIVKHGRYAAAKWAGRADDRAYWEARYCGLQALYSDLTKFPDAYTLFNRHCGVTFAGSHITAADGTTCID